MNRIRNKTSAINGRVAIVSEHRQLYVTNGKISTYLLKKEWGMDVRFGICNRDFDQDIVKN
jgi:hypothetical protein